MAAEGLRIRKLRGDGITSEHWDAFYKFYLNTVGMCQEDYVHLFICAYAYAVCAKSIGVCSMCFSCTTVLSRPTVYIYIDNCNTPSATHTYMSSTDICNTSVHVQHTNLQHPQIASGAVHISQGISFSSWGKQWLTMYAAITNTCIITHV